MSTLDLPVDNFLTLATQAGVQHSSPTGLEMQRSDFEVVEEAGILKAKNQRGGSSTSVGG